MTNKKFKVIKKFPQQGQNGETFEGVEFATNKKVAIKITFINAEIAKLNPNSQKQSNREATLLQKINHKYVVRLVDEVDLNDLLFSGECLEFVHKYDSKLLKCIVTEYIEGKSFYQFRDDYEYSCEDALKIGTRLIFQIGYGLAHCHSQNITHRDLHQNNIIIRNYLDDSRREAVIIDFGLGKMIEQLSDVPHSLMQQGTFRAPEMSNKRFDPTLENCASADLFSLAAIFLWWLTDGDSSSLIKKTEGRYYGLTHYQHHSRPRAIFEIIGQERWEKLKRIIDDVLVDPSVAPYTKREPKTVIEWLNRLREVFPDYDPGDPSQGYLETLGNGVTIEMVRIPERNTYFSKTPITIEQWQKIIGISPFDARANEDIKLTAKGLNFDEINDFIKELNLLTNRHYRLPTSEEIVYFDNFQDSCFANNERLYILHLNSIGSKEINICYKSKSNKICFERGIYHCYRCIGSNIQFCFYISTD